MPELPSVTTLSPLRLVAGLAAAFVMAVFICVFLSCGYALLRSASHAVRATDVGSGVLLVAVSAAYASARLALLAILLLALPHVVISHGLQRTSGGYFVTSGIVIGLIIIAAAELWQRRLPMPPFHMGVDQYFLVALAMAAGAASALVYWKIAYPVR